jgi:hypothetical protein
MTLAVAPDLRRRPSVTHTLSSAVSQRIAFGAFVIAFLAGAAGHAATRPLWYDELLTLYVSQLSSMRAIWDALANGIDLNPPLLHVATRAALMFGESALAVRLPALFGFGIALAGIFAIAAHRQPVRVGWLAAALLTWTHAAAYAYEARPYALVLACTALAYACWQRTPRGRVWAAGLALSLAAAMSGHYYSVLLVPALVAGELVRTWERRRIDLAVWVAFVVAALPLIAWMPLMRGARELSPHYWSRPSVDATLHTFVWLLSGVTVAALVLTGVIALYLAWPRAALGDRAGGEGESQDIALSDWIVALLLAAIPVLAFALGQFTGAYTDRYALPAVIGWCVLLARVPNLLVSSPRTRNALVAGTVAVLLVSVAKHLSDARMISLAPPEVAGLPMLARLPDEPRRVVITEGVLFLQLAHYATPEVRQRMVYPAMPERGIAIAGTNTATAGLQRLQRVMPVNIEPFDTVIARHEPVLVYGRPGWVLTLLHQSGASLNLLDEDGGRLLVHASWPATRIAARSGAGMAESMTRRAIESGPGRPVAH